MLRALEIRTQCIVSRRGPCAQDPETLSFLRSTITSPAFSEAVMVHRRRRFNRAGRYPLSVYRRTASHGIVVYSKCPKGGKEVRLSSLGTVGDSQSAGDPELSWLRDRESTAEPTYRIILLTR